MSEKGYFIRFIMKTGKDKNRTKPGENIYIVGGVGELGNWDVNKSIGLNTNEEKFPKWESDIIQFNAKYTNLEYKYIKKKKDGSLQWENVGHEKNRNLNLSQLDIGYYIVDDGEFSDSSEQKIMIYDDYYNNKENQKDNNINKIINNKKDNFYEDKKDLGYSEEEIKLQETNKIGLQNIGSTCYMNATLQCFCHIPKLISAFKNLNSNLLSNDTLSISFKNLIDNLWKDDFSPNQVENNYYIPTDFRKKIANKSPLFQNEEANDAKDLVNFIIMTLHEELNKPNNNIIGSNLYYQNGFMIDQTNKDLVFKIFLDDFQRNNQSIISQLFYAINLSVTQCSICQNKLYNYQVYYFIVFPLEEVRLFKYQNNFNNFQLFNNNMNNIYNMSSMINMSNMSNISNINNINNMVMSNEVSIYDCFDYDQKMNYMIGQNKMYCNFCKNNNDCVMRTTLVTGPDVLILLLNRGKGIQYNVKINFVEYLNLEKYIEFKDTGFNYELFGVITHIGESGQGGHFIAYCRDPYTNVWSKFNDAIVTEVKSFKDEILDFANPYLLFYQKMIS